MSSPIYFRDERIQCNNMHFGNLIDFALIVARDMPETPEEHAEYARIERFRDAGEFWPGRGMTIEEDFESILACKFWARVFFDLGQAIFMREVGSQDNTAWQAQMIYFAHATGVLFVKAVKEVERGWYPDTRASREYKSLRGQHLA